jgi:tRNA G10  N-methylase Trm11
LGNSKPNSIFIYTYGCRPEETSLCHLELRSFFGEDYELNLLISQVEIDPSRSPFIKERISVIYEGDSVSDIVEQVQGVQLLGSTFKVISLKTNDRSPSEKIEYAEHRAIERRIGACIQGKADVHKPHQVFGVVTLGGRWYFGELSKNRSVYLHHVQKPRSYSMALPVRVARAAVNIAVPNPPGVKAIDPCCGIGTVLVEALSMGIDIVGRDNNPLVAIGARENLAYFELEGTVTLGTIANITEQYDAAIIDMPYNLVSKISPEEQLSILQHARRIASKAVVISIEPIDEMIAEAGFTIADQGIADKGSFTRYVFLLF